ncbi:MAG: Rab family GTPase [Gemmatimonadales bacterium]|nr:Rab family GTPase [Gemmatimonadales bacterium]
MIQKKVCMVGVFGTGKTSLVQRFIHSRFSEKYHSTVGVKIDRKAMTVAGQEVNLVLWDLAGRDEHQDISGSYLRGAHAAFFVVDGTRRETLTQLPDLRRIVREHAGDVPAVVALNKADLVDQWALTHDDEALLRADGVHVLRTSAKAGENVEAAFTHLGWAVLAAREGSA